MVQRYVLLQDIASSSEVRKVSRCKALPLNVKGWIHAGNNLIRNDLLIALSSWRGTHI